FYPADSCGGENHHRWLFFGEKFRDRTFISEIQFRSVPNKQIREALRFEPADECATIHPAMTSNENFLRFIHHEPPSAASIFFFRPLHNPSVGSQSRHPLLCHSEPFSFAQDRLREESLIIPGRSSAA